MPRDMKKSYLTFEVVGSVLCAIWLSVTIAFFAMVTSGGEANMELEIGPFLKLEGRGAIYFCRGLIGFGVLMLPLFVWKRGAGYVLALVWSAWWGVLLSTALLSSSHLSESIAILIAVAFFAVSAAFAWKRLRSIRLSTTAREP